MKHQVTDIQLPWTLLTHPAAPFLSSVLFLSTEETTLRPQPLSFHVAPGHAQRTKCCRFTGPSAAATEEERKERDGAQPGYRRVHYGYNLHCRKVSSRAREKAEMVARELSRLLGKRLQREGLPAPLAVRTLCSRPPTLCSSTPK